MTAPTSRDMQHEPTCSVLTDPARLPECTCWPWTDPADLEVYCCGSDIPILPGATCPTCKAVAR